MLRAQTDHGGHLPDRMPTAHRSWQPSICMNAYDNMIKNGLIGCLMMKKEENTMDKIQMTTPLVEMDGDEMTRILWQMIKDELLLPYIDLKTEYYDLGLEHQQ